MNKREIKNEIHLYNLISQSYINLERLEEEIKEKFIEIKDLETSIEQRQTILDIKNNDYISISKYKDRIMKDNKKLRDIYFKRFKKHYEFVEQFDPFEIGENKND